MQEAKIAKITKIIETIFTYPNPDNPEFQRIFLSHDELVNQANHHKDIFTYIEYNHLISRLIHTSFWTTTPITIMTLNFLLGELNNPLDITYQHPNLHLAASQIRTQPENFKCIWLHDKYKQYHDSEIYKDKYDLTAAQRLSIEMEFLNNDLEQWINTHLKIRRTERKLDYRWAQRFIPPNKKDYIIA